MKVLLTIWISAVLIQEVVPSTLVRLPRRALNKPSMIQTEYEAKYEQKGKQGNESFSSVSGKQHFVHDNCSENWNSFADKCASLIKDLVASLANAVSSNPGDATNLQLHIKNTFKHFDNTHNCTCLNHTGKGLSDLDLSPLFNNITINTVSPSSNGDDGKQTKKCGEKYSTPVPDGEGSENSTKGKPVIVYPTAQQQKQSGGLSDAEHLNPEHDGLSDGSTSNNRRQVNYPQVSKQPKPPPKTPQNPSTSSEQPKNGGKIPPFLVTPQPSYPAKFSPSPVIAVDPTPHPQSESLPSNNSPVSNSGTPSSLSQILGPSANGKPTPKNNYVVPAMSKPQQPSPNEVQNDSGAGQQPIPPGTLSPVPVTSGKNQPTVAIPTKQVANSIISEPEVLGPAVPQATAPVYPVTSIPKSKPAVIVPVPTDPSSNPSGVSAEPVESTSHPDSSVPEKAQPPFINSNSNLPESSTVNPSPVYGALPTNPNPNPSKVVTPAVLVREEDGLPATVAVVKHTTFAPTTTDGGETNTENSKTTTQSITVVKPVPAIPKVVSQQAKELAGPSIVPVTVHPAPVTPESPLEQQPSSNAQPSTTKIGNSQSENVVIATPSSPVEIVTVVPKINQQAAVTPKPEEPGTGGSQKQQPTLNDILRTTPVPVYYPKPVPGTADQQVASPEPQQPVELVPGKVIPQQETPGQGPLSSGSPGTDGAPIVLSSESQSRGKITVPSSEQISSGGAPAVPVQPEIVVPSSGVQSDSENTPPMPTAIPSVPIVPNSESQLASGSSSITFQPLQISPGGEEQPGNKVIAAVPVPVTSAPTVPNSEAQPSGGSAQIVLKPVQSGTAAPSNGEQSGNEGKPAAAELVPSAPLVPNDGSGPITLQPLKTSPAAFSGGPQPGNEEIPAVPEPVPSVPLASSNETPPNSDSGPIILQPVQQVTAAPSGGQQSGSGVPLSVEPVTSAPVVPNSEAQSGSGESAPITLRPVQPAPAPPSGEQQTGKEGIPAVPEPVSSAPVIPNSKAQSGSGSGPITLQPVEPNPVVPNGESQPSSEAAPVGQPVVPSGGEQFGNEGVLPVLKPVPVVPIGGEQSVNEKVPAVSEPVPVVSSDGKQSVNEKVPAVLEPVSVVPSDGKQSGNEGALPILKPVPTGEEQSGNEKVPAVLEPVPVVPTGGEQSVNEKVPAVLEPVPVVPTGGEQSGNEKVPAVLESVPVVPSDGKQSGNEGALPILKPVPTGGEQSVNEKVPAVLEPVPVVPTGGEQSGNEGALPVLKPVPVVPSGGESGTEETLITSSQSPVLTPNNEEGEDSVLLKPTTFQTTSVNTTPAPPVVHQPPTESTKPPVPQGSDSGLLVRASTSPQTTKHHDHDDEDEEEDCCSCESCTDEEVTDAKQYKENACKNLEEARRELKAIFDKIKKKLKCFSKKPPQTVKSS